MSSTSARFLDIITVLSFVVSLENLSLNEQQVNSLDQHLREQDRVLTDEQNSMLVEILKTLKEIKHALKID